MHMRYFTVLNVQEVEKEINRWVFPLLCENYLLSLPKNPRFSFSSVVKSCLCKVAIFCAMYLSNLTFKYV